MTTAALVAVERIHAHQFAEFQEVGHTSRLFQLLVELVRLAGHANIAIELLTDLADLSDRFLKALSVASHAALVPHHLAQAAVELIHRLAAFVVQGGVDAVSDLSLIHI